jgi:hypothetical protein
MSTPVAIAFALMLVAFVAQVVVSIRLPRGKLGLGVNCVIGGLLSVCTSVLWPMITSGGWVYLSLGFVLAGVIAVLVGIREIRRSLNPETYRLNVRD